MIARLWTSTVELPRAHEYEQFARAVSLPMFRRHAGFRGVVMARDAERCMVLTFWADEKAVAALASSADYQEVVARIMDAGFLGTEQDIMTFQVHEVVSPSAEASD